MRSGVAPDEVPNESGLRQLGTRVDEANARPRVRRSGKPKWRARKKIVVALLSVFALLLVSVGGGYAYLWYRFNQIDKVHISDEVAVQSGAPFTILVIGSDSRVGESAQGAKAFGSASTVTGQRSDVVQLWRVTPSTKQIQIVSIPRDTVVSMLPPDSAQYGTYNRINSSYNTGPDQLVKTITANFGIPINHVVQVDFTGFQSGGQCVGRHLPRLPVSGQGRLFGARHHDAGLSTAQRSPGAGRGPGEALRVPGRRVLALRRHE